MGLLSDSSTHFGGFKVLGSRLAPEGRSDAAILVSRGLGSRSPAGSAAQSQASRAGQGRARLGAAEAWLRPIQSTVCFRVPRANPEWDLGLGPSVEGSGRSGLRSRVWRLAPGRAALRRSEGWQALAPEYGGRLEAAFWGLPGSWPRPRPQCCAQPWAPPHG